MMCLAALGSYLFATLLAGSLCTDCTGRDRFMAVYCIMAAVCVVGYVLCLALVWYQRREEAMLLEERAHLPTSTPMDIAAVHGTAGLGAPPRFNVYDDIIRASAAK